MEQVCHCVVHVFHNLFRQWQWWSDHGGNDGMVVFRQSHFTFCAMTITMTIATMVMVGGGRE